jgi:hypothetical protein
VFIRAPWIEEIGPGVEVLAEVDGHPVLAREGRFLVAAFHPELTDDTRLHELFLESIKCSQVPGVPLRPQGTGEQGSNTGTGVGRTQRHETGGTGLRPATAGRPGA